MPKSLVYGRYVSFPSLKDCGFDVEPEIFVVGWRIFFKVNEKVYPELIYEFWKNAEPVEGTLVSTVDNMFVVVTQEEIVQAIQCAEEGEAFYNRTYWIQENRMDEETINRQIYGEDHLEIKKASSLIPQARFLHSILFH